MLENVSQESCFSQCAHEVVDSLLAGYNGTIFCYGQVRGHVVGGGMPICGHLRCACAHACSMHACACRVYKGGHAVLVGGGAGSGEVGQRVIACMLMRLLSTAAATACSSIPPMLTLTTHNTQHNTQLRGERLLMQRFASTPRMCCRTPPPHHRMTPAHPWLAVPAGAPSQPESRSAPSLLPCPHPPTPPPPAHPSNTCEHIYLQTGAGKTFTMSGEPNNYGHRGVIPRAIHNAFREVDMRVDKLYKIQASGGGGAVQCAWWRTKPHSGARVRYIAAHAHAHAAPAPPGVRCVLAQVSYLEIYNEQLYDLLSDSPGTSTDSLAVLEDTHGNTYVGACLPAGGGL